MTSMSPMVGHHSSAGRKRYPFLVSLALWTLLLSILISTARAEVEVLGMRIGNHPDKTRVVFDLSEHSFFDFSYQDDPREILVELRKTQPAQKISALIKRMQIVGLVEKLSVEKFYGNIRFRIKLRQAATIGRSFILKPIGEKPTRLVFDLQPVSEAEWQRLVALSNPVISAPVEKPVPAIPELKPEPVIEREPAPVEESFAEEDYDEGISEDYNGFSFSGYVEVEGRAFTQSGLSPVSKDWTASFAVEPRLEYVSESGNSQVTIDGFARVDVNDSERSHVDLRAFKWTGLMDNWQMTLGIDTIFWGVTESVHLVDIINQDDMLEDIDQEDKLGQPMVSLSYDSDFGVFSAYVMTYFRERRFPGVKGRLGVPLPIDYSQTQYEAGSDKWHMDWAVRWSHVVGDFDIGLSHFQGTSRDPLLLPSLDGTTLIPRYGLIKQTGLDLQGTFDGLLLKFEAIRHRGAGPDYWALAGGFEYTFYGLFGGDSDVGLIGEYIYDDRGALATTPFEDDVFAGLRWAMNDVDSTEFLMGAIFDLNSSATFFNLESSRRLGDDWKITLDARFFLGVPMSDPLYFISRDDFVQIRLARYF